MAAIFILAKLKPPIELLQKLSKISTRNCGKTGLANQKSIVDRPFFTIACILTTPVEEPQKIIFTRFEKAKILTLYR